MVLRLHSFDCIKNYLTKLNNKYNLSYLSFVLSVDFQEPASVTAEGLAIFNVNLLFIISNIVIFVGWILMLICLNFFDETTSKKTDFTHSNSIEIIWTLIPSLLLIILASPSFALLYSLEEVSTPELTCKITGHQWYWTYEISQFNTKFKYSFSSYGVSDEFLKKPENLGLFRVMETNKRLILPSNTVIRLLVTSADVLHSWAVPSFQIKVDACPGRLNETNLFIKSIGIYYGLCSEICGVNHGYMPIVVVACNSLKFYELVSSFEPVVEPVPAPVPDKLTFSKVHNLRDLINYLQGPKKPRIVPVPLSDFHEQALNNFKFKMKLQEQQMALNPNPFKKNWMDDYKWSSKK